MCLIFKCWWDWWEWWQNIVGHEWNYWEWRTGHHVERIICYGWHGVWPTGTYTDFWNTSRHFELFAPEVKGFLYTIPLKTFWFFHLFRILAAVDKKYWKFVTMMEIKASTRGNSSEMQWKVSSLEAFCNLTIVSILFSIKS